MGAVVAHPDQARHRADPSRQLAQLGQHLGSLSGRKRERLAQPDRLGHGLVDQRRQIVGDAELAQHAIDVVGSWTDVARLEVVVQQRGERGGLRRG